MYRNKLGLILALALGRVVDDRLSKEDSQPTMP